MKRIYFFLLSCLWWSIPVLHSYAQCNVTFSIQALVTDDKSCTESTGAIDLHVIPAGVYFYNWSNGSTTEDLTKLEAGNYAVTVTDEAGCSSILTVPVHDVSAKPIISAHVCESTCKQWNGSIALAMQPDSIPFAYRWSTGNKTSAIAELEEGWYYVTVTDSLGCSATADFEIKSTDPPSIALQADLTSCPPGENVNCHLNINVPLGAINKIQWTPQDLISCTDNLCVDQEIKLTGSTTIHVTVTDSSGCTAEASLAFIVRVPQQVYIPNVFSPDADGRNDRFTVFANEDVKEVERLAIFDRWGNCVFVSSHFPPNQSAFGWGGDFNGEPMQTAVYVYSAVIRLMDDRLAQFNGDITLIR